MSKKFYKCKLTMKKITFHTSPVLLFKKGVTYEAIDSDDKCIMLTAENADLVIVEAIKLRKHFRCVNIMPEFPQ